jgi:hypothetical protein
MPEFPRFKVEFGQLFWDGGSMHYANAIHRRREIPNLKISIGVPIGQKKKCLQKVSPLSSSCQNTNLHPNCCEWSSWFTNLVFITNTNSILGYDISMWIPDRCHVPNWVPGTSYKYTQFGKTTGALFQQKYRCILSVLTPSAFIYTSVINNI